MEETLAAFVHLLFNWRFRANSLENGGKNMYFTLHFLEILRRREFTGMWTRALKDVYVYLGEVAILDGRVMWFWYVGINPVAQASALLKVSLSEMKGLRCWLFQGKPQSTCEHTCVCMYIQSTWRIGPLGDFQSTVLWLYLMTEPDLMFLFSVFLVA